MKSILSEQQLREGVHRLAERIDEDYAGRSLTIIGVLTGSIILLADLIRLIHCPLRVGVVQARSYRGMTTTRGPLRINAELMPDIEGRHVLLLDDIFDTGHTMAELVEQLRRLGPTSIRSAVLLRKQGRQQVSINPDYVAFDIPDAFVVGYGLDYNDEHRNLPYVAALEDSDLAVEPRA